jgi:hypothetical protein
MHDALPSTARPAAETTVGEEACGEVACGPPERHDELGGKNSAVVSFVDPSPMRIGSTGGAARKLTARVGVFQSTAPRRAILNPSGN